jgi:hypothetical protein
MFVAPLGPGVGIPLIWTITMSPASTATESVVSKHGATDVAFIVTVQVRAVGKPLMKTCAVTEYDPGAFVASGVATTVRLLRIPADGRGSPIPSGLFCAERPLRHQAVLAPDVLVPPLAPRPTRRPTWPIARPPQYPLRIDGELGPCGPGGPGVPGTPAAPAIPWGPAAPVDPARLAVQLAPESLGDRPLQR